MKQTTLDKLKGDTLTAVDNDLSAWFWDEKVFQQVNLINSK